MVWLDGMPPMPVKDWLPANVRAAAVDHKLKSGETLFGSGTKLSVSTRSLLGACGYRVLIAQGAKLFCMWPGRMKRSRRLLRGCGPARMLSPKKSHKTKIP